MKIPELETERLLLRAFRDTDIDAVTAMYADADVTRFITHDGQPKDREYGWRAMAMLSGHWMLRGYGMWAVEVKESGVLAGYVGPFYPESWPDQEIGWTIAKPMWGHGYATEAAQAALTYARNTLKWPRVIHLIDPENVKSIAVAKRLGSQQDGEWVRNDKPLHIYAQSLNAK